MREKYKRFSTRERILRSAARLFAMKGRDGTSVEEIMAAAGMTKPVMYYHFENKADLCACVEEYVRRRICRLEDRALSVGGPLKKKLAVLFTCYFRLAKLNARTARIFRRMMLSTQNEESRLRAVAAMREHLERLETTLVSCLRGDCLPEQRASDLAQLVYSVINYFTLTCELSPQLAPDASLPKRFAQMAADSLGPRRD
jgi:AcrR family transcriptional regulator